MQLRLLRAVLDEQAGVIEELLESLLTPHQLALQRPDRRPRQRNGVQHEDEGRRFGCPPLSRRRIVQEELRLLEEGLQRRILQVADAEPEEDAVVFCLEFVVLHRAAVDMHDLRVEEVLAIHDINRLWAEIEEVDHTVLIKE